MRIVKLTESDIQKLIKKVLSEQENDRYMFFSNLEQIKRQCDLLLELNEDEIHQILENGHDWAQDHIATAKESIDQVFDFLMNETKKGDSDMSQDMGMMTESEMTERKKKNTPTNPSLWSKSLSWAKSRYKVCPSAYCNGAAAKHYKSLGGKWKKK
jgi:dsDNA-specific endonuclease/ATPase MutS2